MPKVAMPIEGAAPDAIAGEDAKSSSGGRRELPSFQKFSDRPSDFLSGSLSLLLVPGKLSGWVGVWGWFPCLGFELAVLLPIVEIMTFLNAADPLLRPLLNFVLMLAPFLVPWQGSSSGDDLIHQSFPFQGFSSV